MSLDADQHLLLPGSPLWHLSVIPPHSPAPTLPACNRLSRSAPRLLGSTLRRWAPHTHKHTHTHTRSTSADPSRGLLSCGSLLQNGVVRVCAERAALLRRPVLPRPRRLPGAAGRLFPQPAVGARWPRSPRWAAASLLSSPRRRRRFCLRRCFRFPSVRTCRGAGSVDSSLLRVSLPVVSVRSANRALISALKRP